MTANLSSLQKGLVAHYPLNGESETKDITPNANHGTNNGATLSTGRKGEANGSYEFVNTQNDRILINKDLIGTGNITTSAWFYAYSLGEQNAGRIVATEKYWIAVTTGNKFYGASVGGAPMPSTEINSFRLNTWNHIVLTRNSAGLMNFYLNGVLIGLPNQDSGTPVAGTTTQIGNSPALDRDFDGKITDVKIYNRILEEDEIKLLYDSFKPEIATSDLNKGLVGHWMLDSENGAKDLTPNGNHGTAYGGVTVGGTTDRKWKTGGATEFDGTDDKIVINNGLISGISNFSVSMWINRDTGVSYYPIFDFGTSPTHGLSLHGGDVNRLEGGDGLGHSFDITFGTSLSYNSWNNIIITYDGLSFRKYLNGNYDANYDWSYGIGTPTSFTIGDFWGPNYKGSISDVRIYNRALSTDEIKLLYDQYKPKEASIGSLNKGLVLDMPLTTKHMKSSTVVSDRTPYSNDGTVSGATVGSQYTSFDGVDDYIEVAHSDSLNMTSNQISFGAWVKSTGNSGQHRFIFEKGDANFHPFALTISTANKFRAHLDFNEGGRYWDGNTTVNLNDWYYAMETYDGSTLRLYVNGVLDKEELYNYTIKNSTENLLIGIRDGSLYPFIGSISNAKIWNRALSAEEIAVVYAKGRV